MIDQIFDSGPIVKENEIRSFFGSQIGIIPDDYRELLLRHNGGKIHPAASKLSNGDALIELFPIGDVDYTSTVKVQKFDKEESSVPSELQPSLMIGKTWESMLYMSMSVENTSKLFLYSIAYDELTMLDGSITDLLSGLEKTDVTASTLEPSITSQPPWSLISEGKYDLVLTSLDNNVDEACPDDEMQRTCLMLALGGRRFNLSARLIERGATADKRDSAGKPALFYSAEFFDGLKLCKANNADLNLCDNTGNNLLHHLANASHELTGGETRCFDWLVANGVDTKKINDLGQTPRDILEQKIVAFREHYSGQPHMTDLIPNPIIWKIRKLEVSAK